MLFRHRKSSKVYEVMHLAVQEDSLEPVVVYRERPPEPRSGGISEDSPLVWVRPAFEFFDGRFELVFAK